MTRDRRRVGVIVAPRYFDTTSTELTALASGVDVLHTQIRVEEDFGFSLDEIVQTADEIEACAASLAAAGAEVVVQLGTPFSTAHGWHGGTQLQAHIAERVGVPFEMMGLAVPAGVTALGARSVAIASTYYGPEWIDRYTGFATDAGLAVTASQSFVDQGLFATHEEAFGASFDGFDPAVVVGSIAKVARDVPEADAILVPGIPCKLLDRIPQLEARLGRPVVSYFAIWWRCLLRLGLTPGAGHGMLLGTLG